MTSANLSKPGIHRDHQTRKLQGIPGPSYKITSMEKKPAANPIGICNGEFIKGTRR